MARREYTQVFRCAEPGCRENTISVASNKRDANEHAKYRLENPYRCLRHIRPNEVLSETSTYREATVTVVTEKYGNKWHGDRYPQISVDGPGFRAFAADFPPGTTLRITAQIQLPAAAEEEGHDAQDHGHGVSGLD